MNRLTIKKSLSPKLALAKSLLRSVMISSLLVLSAGAPSVYAKEAEPMANDVQVEARLVHIAEELRCLVCQNESLSSSHADLAEDLRAQVREQIVSGKSDQEIKDYLVERYGDFVLYRPVVKPMTWLLWFGPFAGLLIALLGLGISIKRRNEKIQEKSAVLAAHSTHSTHSDNDPDSDQQTMQSQDFREPGLGEPTHLEPDSKSELDPQPSLKQPISTAHSKA